MEFLEDATYPTQFGKVKKTVISEIKSRLSIVVLPFANLNNDPKQDQFADTIAREMTIDIARTPATFVIGYETAALIHKDRPTDLKQFGAVLGVRWAVQGAVKSYGDQVRINVSLTDLQTAPDIWSDWFDGDRTNLVALHNNITARLLCVVHLHLRQYEEAIEKCSRSLNVGANLHAYISRLLRMGEQTAMPELDQDRLPSGKDQFDDGRFAQVFIGS